MCARDRCSRKMPTDTPQNAKKIENTFQPDCRDTFCIGVLGQAKQSRAASVCSGVILQHMSHGILHQESAVTEDTRSMGESTWGCPSLKGG